MRTIRVHAVILGVLSVLTADAGVAQVADNAQLSAAVDAWQIEMAYVKANKPQHVNGFLVGSGGGAMGSIVLKKALSKIESDAFTCTLLKPVTADQKWSAFVKDNQSWSMSDVQVGQSAFPIVAMVKTSTDKVFAIFPATLRATTEIKAGAAVTSKDYVITAARAIKAGDTFPVLIVGHNILSVEATDGKPWFTAVSSGQ
jgi:hypothetical protein